MENKRFDQILCLFGHIGFLILTVLSIVLANERVIYIDSAAQVYEMTLHTDFAIYDHRYTMFLTQLLPLLAIRFGMDLQAVVVAYSVAAPLLAWAAYSLIAHGMKDVRLALLLLLPILCIRHTFFHGISESFSLMIYATLLLALLRHRPGSNRGIMFKVLHLLGIALTTAAAAFIHPIGVFFILFLLGYQLVEQRFRPTVAIAIGAAVMLAAVAIRITNISGHDSGYMPTLDDVKYCLQNPGDIKVLKGFVRFLGDLYIYPILLYIIVLIYHIMHHKWMQLAYGVLFNLCFIAMTIVVYRWDGSSICIERAWIPIIFFSGAPFVCEVLPNWKMRRQQLYTLIFGAVLLLQFGKIADTSRHYRQRLDKMREVAVLANSLGQHKLVAAPGTGDAVFDVPSWCTAFESHIVSALEGKEHTVNLYIEEENFDPCNPDYRDTHSYLAVPWWRLWKTNTLPTRYFYLPEQEYMMLTFTPDGTPQISPLPCQETSEDVADSLSLAIKNQAVSDL